jgi:SAM-dependent methyltransferase
VTTTPSVARRDSHVRDSTRDARPHEETPGDVGRSRWLRKLVLVTSLLGLDARRLLSLRHAGRFARDCWRYHRQARNHRFPLRLADLMPVLTDLDAEAGSTRGHYFHQDLWAARRIFAARPGSHIDVGSRIDGFVGHVLAFMPVTVVDIRPLQSDVPGLTFVRGSCLDLGWIETGSVESISSLHAVEHFGLGRYGDTVDGSAWQSGMRELSRVLRPGGRLYFSVPIGVERVEFNAHRIFNPRTVLEGFSDLRLMSFASVGENGDFFADASPDAFEHVRYACGLFEFTKA